MIATSPATPSPSARLLLVGLIVVIVASYLPGLDNGLAGDDLDWVFAAVKTAHDPMYLLTAQTYFFRPTEQAFFTLALIVDGTRYPVYLFGVLLLHLAAVWLVAEFARELTGDAIAAIAGTSWWALHHAHAEVILRPYGVADPLALVFGLASFRAYRRGRPMVAACALAVALGGKENAIVLPAAFTLWALLEGTDLRRRLLHAAPLWGMAIAVGLRGLATRSGAPSYLEVSPAAVSNFWENVAGWFGPDLHYLRFAVLQRDAPLIPPLVGAALLLATAFALRFADRRVRFAVLWIPITMLPSVFVPQQAARYHYAPMVGAALLLAVGIARLRPRSTRRSWVVGAVSVLVAAQLMWNLIGIQVERADFQVYVDLHTQATASFRSDVLPVLLDEPGAVAVFLRPDGWRWADQVRSAWDRHPWWVPTSYKWLFRRSFGILGFSNTWAFVSAAAVDRTDTPLFVVAPPDEVRIAVAQGTLRTVIHDERTNTFSVAPPGATPLDSDDLELGGEWVVLQPGRFDPTFSGTAYP